MSDNEEEWKPSGRPQSTMALSLAATLDDAFSLDSDVDNLSNSISYKQQMVTMQNRELEALEARIREAEQRLNKSGSEGAGSSDSDETAKPKESSQAKERPNATEKNHNPQFSSSSSGSHPSDEDSTGSAASGAEGAANERYRGTRGVTKEQEKGKRPQF